MPTVHEFKKSLDRSDSVKCWAFYLSAVERFWPGTLDWERVTDLTAQKRGEDLILRSAGKRIVIQIKARFGAKYPDILIEFEHVFTDGTVKRGWVCCQSTATHLLYCYPEHGIGYLLDYREIENAWKVNGVAWRERFGVREAPNKEYVTRNVPVTFDALSRAGVHFKSFMATMDTGVKVERSSQMELSVTERWENNA